MASSLDWLEGAWRRGREEVCAMMGSVPAILFHRERAPSSSSFDVHLQDRSPGLVLTHKYVIGLFAFLISVDLVEITGVLCYELFTASYFPWHVYPLMLNRAAELLSLLYAKGQILTAFSIAQVFLSLVSLTIFSKKQPCGTTNCIGPLILYGILMSYQIFVAVIMIKLSRMPMADDEGQIVANWPSLEASTDSGHNPLGIQLMGIPNRRTRARVHDVAEDDLTATSRLTLQKMLAMDVQEEHDVVLTVEQPDGKKIAIAKLCKEVKWMDEPTHTPSLPNLCVVVQDSNRMPEANALHNTSQTSDNVEPLREVDHESISCEQTKEGQDDATSNKAC